MATVALTKDTFEQTVTGGGIVLVDFWAAWCAPCRRFAPVYEQASHNHPDIVFGKVDTEAEQDLAAAAGIYSIPTLMAIRDGDPCLPTPALFARAGGGVSNVRRGAGRGRLPGAAGPGPPLPGAGRPRPCTPPVRAPRRSACWPRVTSSRWYWTWACP